MNPRLLALATAAVVLLGACASQQPLRDNQPGTRRRRARTKASSGTP
jgi:hypothetical protein